MPRAPPSELYSLSSIRDVAVAEAAYVLGAAPVMPATSIDVNEQQRQQEVDCDRSVDLANQQLPS
jgi:hypothetical protein